MRIIFMSRIFLSFGLSLLTFLFALSASGEDFAVQAKRIITNDGRVIDNGFVKIDENGNLSLIDVRNTKVEIKAEEVLTGKDLWVTPGLFAAYSTLGLAEVSGARSTNNTDATTELFSVNVQAKDSFNPKSTLIPITRLGGVLHMAVAPGSGQNLFGGRGLIANTSGDFGSIITNNNFVYFNLAGSSKQTGSTKGAAFAFLRGALGDAQRLVRSSDEADALSRADAQALRPVILGKVKLVVGADQAIDIKNLIELKRDWPKLDIVIVGAAEGWMLAKQLAAANIAVIIDPVENLPANFDRIASRPDNAKILINAGVETAFMTRSVTIGGSAHNLRLLAQAAGNAVAQGVDWESAFKAVSLWPASMYGLTDLGRLRAGKKANLVVWDGDPLEVTSAPVAIFIDGKKIPLQSRQTKLRDRYNPVKKNNMLYGYVKQ